MHPSLALPIEKKPNHVPVNITGHRLDIWLPAPASEDWKAYSARISMQGKLCNEYQLKGYCTKGGVNCILDHSPISENIKLVLRHMVHSYPCSRKGDCRRENCNMGHICFRDKCDSSKRNGACRLNNSMHNIDPVVSEWAMAEPDNEIYNPESSGTTSGGNDSRERDVPPHAASGVHQHENDIDLYPYAPTHFDDLD